MNYTKKSGTEGFFNFICVTVFMAELKLKNVRPPDRSNIFRLEAVFSRFLTGKSPSK